MCIESLNSIFLCMCQCEFEGTETGNSWVNKQGKPQLMYLSGVWGHAPLEISECARSDLRPFST